MSRRRAFWILFALAVAVRIVLAAIYRPHIQPDSPGYLAVAQRIWDGSFAGFNGGRTPGYPLLLVAAAMNLYVVWFIQAAMGIAVTLMLFDLIVRRTGSATAG